MVSRHSVFVMASAWSSARATGAWVAATAATNRATTVTPPPEVRIRNADGSIGSIRASPTARWASRTAGSLSPSSQETQATRGRRRSAHCASSVVLP